MKIHYKALDECIFRMDSSEREQAIQMGEHLFKSLHAVTHDANYSSGHFSYIGMECLHIMQLHLERNEKYCETKRQSLSDIFSMTEERLSVYVDYMGRIDSLSDRANDEDIDMIIQKETVLFVEKIKSQNGIKYLFESLRNHTAYYHKGDTITLWDNTVGDKFLAKALYPFLIFSGLHFFKGQAENGIPMHYLLDNDILLFSSYLREFFDTFHVMNPLCLYLFEILRLCYPIAICTSQSIRVKDSQKALEILNEFTQRYKMNEGRN